MAKLRGARVIATVGSEAKAVLARKGGADEVLHYDEIEHVRGVDVVYDSVGQTTFLKSLDCLKPRGMMVSFGQSSGLVPAIEPLLLSAKGSLTSPGPPWSLRRQSPGTRVASLRRPQLDCRRQTPSPHPKQYPWPKPLKPTRTSKGANTSGKMLLP